MKIELTAPDVALLEARNIAFAPGQDYAEDDALALLDAVRDSEVYYSQGEDAETQRLYSQYAALGDKLFALIPEA